MTAPHPGQPGTRACWAAGCVQYGCVIAADVDPVAVERYLHGERSLRYLTHGEREEVLRRQPYVERSQAVRGRVPVGRVRDRY